MKKLSLEEKIGQLSCNLFGWKCYENNGKKFTSYLENEIAKYGTVGSLYGLLRSDPWSKVSHENGIPTSATQKVVAKLNTKLAGSTTINPFFFEEAPHGHQALNATTMPVNLAIGCTFNPNLYKVACSLVAREMRNKGVNVGLLSCLDVALDPRWGRTEECYGEDTYLAMEMAKNAILGFQGGNEKIDSNHIGIVAKHFIGQGSAQGGHNGGSVPMGSNELKAHHLPIAQSCIDAKVLGFMAAYNDIDSVPCHANRNLLIDTLRKEMNFKGFVMSDGCAVDNLLRYLSKNEEAIAKAISSGVDVDLWNTTFNYLVSAVKSNFISEKEIDRAYNNVIAAKKRLGLIGNFSVPKTKLDVKKIMETNYSLACESLVLLENDGILPMKNIDSSCLIGPYINDIYHQLGDYTPFKDTNKLKSLAAEFNIPSSLGSYPRSYDKGLIDEATKLASSNKYVILNLGSSSARDFNTEFQGNGAAVAKANSMQSMDCGEGMDVADIELPEAQLKLFNAIYKVNKNIIVIVTSGRTIGISKIKNKARAIIQSFYGGEEIQRAIKNTIIGLNNPSGRLSISVPISSSQIPVYYWLKEKNNYVDMPCNPLYSFGYGKSYSEINISLINAVQKDKTKFECNVEITNNSKIDAKWPILVFAQLLETEIKPPFKVLVGFKKMSLKPNETIKTKISIDTNWLFKNYKYKNIKFIVE